MALRIKTATTAMGDFYPQGLSDRRDGNGRLELFQFLVRHMQEL
jgi:hypothetical protein